MTKTINDFLKNEENHEPKVEKTPLERDKTTGCHDCLGHECYENWKKI
jgi:hypothetical protein